MKRSGGGGSSGGIYDFFYIEKNRILKFLTREYFVYVCVCYQNACEKKA